MSFVNQSHPGEACVRNAIRAIALAALLMIPHAGMQAQELPASCGVLRMEGRFGPYDYRADHYIPENTYRSHQALLSIVESRHFTPNIEANIRGNTSTQPGPDMVYTLHAFPNHHRALLSMIALGEKEHTDKPFGSPYVVECWFKRALAFRPDDHIVRLIYASYLVQKGGRNDEAEAQLKYVANDPESNAFTFRNIGLIYLEMKRYDEALKFAHKSMALGLPGGPLQERLAAAGHWQDESAAEKPEPK